MLDRRVMQILKITESKNLWLALGSARHKVNLYASPKKGILSMSAPLFKQLGLQSGLRMRLRFDGETRTLTLGPILVLLLQNGARSGPQTFGEMSAYCRELALAARKEGVWLVIASPAGVRLTQKTLVGWSLHRHWVRLQAPLPDVLYNRLQTREVERRPLVQKIFKNLKNNFNTAVFNEQFLDKIGVFTELAKDANSRKHLPLSVACTKLETLRRMMTKYPVVFLKPTAGRMGKGIIRIARRAEGGFLTQSTSTNGTRNRIHENFAKLGAFVKPRIRRKAHLVQQGLTLLKVYRQNLDFRALVQKDRSGEWSITSIVGRIAGPRHFVSNLARGGRMTTVLNALTRAGLAVNQAKSVAAEMRKAALLLAGALDKQMNGSFGELGVDLAVDRNLQIWLLEINAKPSKTEPLPTGSRKVRPSARKVMHYTRFLSKF